MGLRDSIKKALFSRPAPADPVSKASAERIQHTGLFSEIGTSGLKHFSGRLAEEFLQELQGKNGVKRLREMKDNDAVVGGMLTAQTMLIRSVDWHVQPSKAGALPVVVAQEDADFVQSCMDDMEHTWPEFMSEVASMLWPGFALFEPVFKIRGGPDGRVASTARDFRIGWRKLAFRAQESIEEWVIGQHGEILGAQQRDPASGRVVVLPMDRIYHFRTSAEKNNPRGRSTLRNGYVDYRYKAGEQEIESIAIERDAVGIPVARVPAVCMAETATAAQRAQYDAAKKMVRNIRVDEQEGVVLPGEADGNGNFLFSLELLSAGGSRQIDTSTVIERHDRAIAGSVLADFMLLGHAGTGSYALSSDKTELFAVALGGYLDIIQETINRVMIPDLWAVNGFKRPHPTLQHADIETVDLAALGGYVQAMTNAGYDLTDRDTEEELRAQGGLPPVPAERPEGYLEDDPDDALIQAVEARLSALRALKGRAEG